MTKKNNISGKRTRLSDQELLDDLRRVAEQEGRINGLNYNTCGNHATSYIKRRFGSFSAAVKRAGIEEAIPARITSKAEPVTCLKCNKVFKSWDRKKNRICSRCKESEAWDLPGYFPLFRD